MKQRARAGIEVVATPHLHRGMDGWPERRLKGFEGANSALREREAFLIGRGVMSLWRRSRSWLCSLEDPHSAMFRCPDFLFDP
jgi:hypothetical protein